MREIRDRFEETGISVVFFVMGTAQEAADFCGAYGLAGRCIGDERKSTYAAMGLERFNLLRLFRDPDLRARREENRKAGFRQNWRATKLKNAAQLPGAAFVDAAGVVRWLHRGKHPGDLPSMQAMLDVARAIST